MFRASPWISYEPSLDSRYPNSSDPIAPDFDDMDEDVDMDAPQISTLREEETPPPQPSHARTHKFRVKLLVNENKGSGSPSSSAARKAVAGQTEDEDGEDEDEEDEEDQLIDDDDDMNPTPPAPLPLPRHLDVPQKRRPSHKRKPKKTEKQIAEDERKAREKIHIPAGAQSPAPAITWFEVAPPESELNQGIAEGSSLDVGRSVNTIVAPQPLPPKISLKKKVAPRKAPAAPRSKAKACAKSALIASSIIV